jgi:hypothetical protein
MERRCCCCATEGAPPVPSAAAAAAEPARRALPPGHRWLAPSRFVLACWGGNWGGEGAGRRDKRSRVGRIEDGSVGRSGSGTDGSFISGFPLWPRGLCCIGPMSYI